MTEEDVPVMDDDHTSLRQRPLELAAAVQARDANANWYVILVPETGGKGRLAIGPFVSRDTAQEYLTESGSELKCSVLRMVSPLPEPDDDADLNP